MFNSKRNNNILVGFFSDEFRDDFSSFSCFFFVHTPSFSQPTFDVVLHRQQRRLNKMWCFLPLRASRLSVKNALGHNAGASRLYFKTTSFFRPLLCANLRLLFSLPAHQRSSVAVPQMWGDSPFCAGAFLTRRSRRKHSSQQRQLWWPFKWPQWHHRPLCTQGVTLLNGSYLGWVHRLWYNFKRMGTL